MAYVCELGSNQRVYLDNRGTQTVVTTVSSGAGQQQQSSSGFDTGAWTSPPMMYRTPDGVVLQVRTERGDRTIQIQGQQMQSQTAAQPERIPLNEVDEMPAASEPSMEPMKPMEPMQPMQPMQPMKMGDMEMNANPMEMRMGNMEMKMGSPPSMGGQTGGQTGSQRRFCSQCGAPVQAGDRFCGSCGNRLS
ncbi:zinc ribbon domain-containing protein [Baaleninema sp.]|uniref:zinc ribbon domain-containing protein n=1 Tax=Baaleninema sp. TaxID=3101197 RepID=UPI003D04746E